VTARDISNTGETCDDTTDRERVVEKKAMALINIIFNMWKFSHN